MRSATNTNNTVWGVRMDALTKVLENVGYFLAAVPVQLISGSVEPKCEHYATAHQVSMQSKCLCGLDAIDIHMDMRPWTSRTSE